MPARQPPDYHFNLMTVDGDGHRCRGYIVCLPHNRRPLWVEYPVMPVEKAWPIMKRWESHSGLKAMAYTCTQSEGRIELTSDELYDLDPSSPVPSASVV